MLTRAEIGLMDGNEDRKLNGPYMTRNNLYVHAGGVRTFASIHIKTFNMYYRLKFS